MRVLGRWKRAHFKVPKGAEGWRAYVVGDVHGRLDLLEAALRQVEADNAARGVSARPLLVFLGDLIDRGPQSAQVVALARSNPLDGFRTIVLAGNHEEVLLRLLVSGERGLFQQWLGFGGDACVRSYGGDPELLAALPEQDALARLRELIPAEDLTFLRGLGDTLAFGDYLFVHAGIRPGITLSDQSPMDLRWIRRAFLDDPRDHGAIVVHGHTISEQVDERPNRIGIDTGAYHHGVLTVLGIEGGERWYIQQRETAPVLMEGMS